MDPQHTQHIWFLDTVVLYWTRDERLFVSYGYDFQLLTPVAFDTIHGDPHVMNTEYRFQLVRSQNIINAQNCIVRNNEYYRLPANIVERMQTTRTMLTQLGVPPANAPVVAPQANVVGDRHVNIEFGSLFRFNGKLSTLGGFCIGILSVVLWNYRNAM